MKKKMRIEGDLKMRQQPILIQKLETKTSKGMLSKGWYISSNNEVYLVKGNSDEGGYEPQAECLVSNLLDLLNINHVRYKLESISKYPDIKVYKNQEYVSVCKSYLTENIIETFTFCDYIDLIAKEAGKIKVYDYWNWTTKLKEDLKKDIYLMLQIDALVGNEDRHLNNWDLVRTVDGNIELAPILDFGASLLSWHRILPDIKQGKIGPDKSKPFRDTHSEQIKLLCKDGYSKTINFDFNQWLKISTDILNTMNIKRVDAICNYLLNRMEVYCDICY